MLVLWVQDNSVEITEVTSNTESEQILVLQSVDLESRGVALS